MEKENIDHKKIAGILNEQIDSVLRRWLAGEFTDPELELYLMQFSREGVVHALMATLNLLKKKSLEAIPKLVKGLDVSELPKSLGEMVSESDMKEIAELDGLVNQLLNEQITLVEFVERTEKVSKKTLTYMLAGLTIVMKKVGEESYEAER